MKTALLIIDHGSKRKEANHMLFEMVQLLQSHRPDLIIYGAHMELAIPTINDGINWCLKKGATHIIAHPYMLSPGRHATEDIPRLVKEALANHAECSYDLASALGPHELLADLLIKRSPFSQEDNH